MSPAALPPQARTMTRRKVWLATSATVLLFLVIAAVAALLLHPHGRDWILLAGVVLLGVAAAVLVYYFLSARLPATEAAAPPDDPVDAAAAAARARLAAVGAPGRLPGVLVLGPAGSAKSTVVTESGLNPELVAGEATRGAPTPTTANVWYAQGTVLVEAGGGLLDQPARWQKLMRHFRPRRLSAALLGRPQAPRLAVVCFPCDELVRPGAAQSAPAAAQALRTRLLETARQFGVRLPVYVLFTRTDRVPHFTEYVRSLSREEAQEVLGATLPALPPVAAALHAERETQRVGAAFEALIGSLALRRSQLLPREAEEVVRATAYEFPRELHKASEAAVQFLVELTRPSHLSISPFLRGFYFTGVRPIVVDDGAVAAPVAVPRPDGALAATGVFDARALQAAVAQAAAPRGSRRIPEWVFLRRLFPEVILADRAAAGATARGSRVDALRRAGLAAATLVCVFLAGAFAVSYAGNRHLEADALAAARDVPTVDAAYAGAASTDALQRLDGLRAQAARLRTYVEAGAPWHLRWGLFTGKSVLQPARAIYFRAFGGLLWRGTQDSLVASLRAVPDRPNGTADYGRTYEALEAHLVTTSYADSATGSFLGPVLLGYWRDPAPQALRADLARRQFEFFGNELPFGDPFHDGPDKQLIAQAQHFLGQFGSEEPLYAALLSDANSHFPSVAFSRANADAAGIVRDEVVVPGAFTRDGWKYVQGRLKDYPRLFAAKPWVVGTAAVEPRDQARIAAALGIRYVADYKAQWQKYLDAASVSGFGGVEEARNTTARLGGPQSPLLRLLALASTNTAVDTTDVGKMFRSVQAVVPPGLTDKVAAPPNEPYLKGLIGVSSALGAVVSAPEGQRSAQLPTVTPAVGQVSDAVSQLTSTFPTEGPAQPVSADVTRLLNIPVAGLQALIQRLPMADVSAGANGKGRAMCQQVTPILAKYPFNSRGTMEASIEELKQLFQPGSNSFTQLAGGLTDLIVPQGAGWGPKYGASPPPRPAFIHFLNQAVEFSHAFYDGDAGPQVSFTLKPMTTDQIPEITVTVDGVSYTFTRTMAASRVLTWHGTSSPHEVSIAGKVHNVETTAVHQTGTWAVFRALQQADWKRSGAGWLLTWHLPDVGDINAQLDGGQVFRRDYFGGFSCVGQIVQ